VKAVVISTTGNPDVLRIQDRERPALAAGHVLIHVHAAGVNRPDIAQRKGNYPAPAGAPADIPGLEVAGIIEECGDNVSMWKKGDAVCALLAGGGYAEYALAPEGQCLPLPKGCDFTAAASFPETIFTVWHNVFQRGALKAGEHLLVHGGSSGIGVTAIQLAKALGSTVSTTAGSDEKCQACIALGADQAINYKNSDFEMTLSPTGVDVILDMVGGDYIPKNIKLLKPDGRLVFINAMKGGNVEWNAVDIMRRRITITGSTLRNRDITFKASLAKSIQQNVWPLIESGKFKPVIFKTFPMHEAHLAHELMERSGHIGKIVLTNA
jgi:putative PIG3 family NAD(P)H quinone oxidoreductase